jgi:putative ABC transport system permease protein
MIGIIIALLLVPVMNLIILNVAGLAHVAALPAFAVILLVLISMGLTLIAGIFPSRMAAKQDPVVALRSE